MKQEEIDFGPQFNIEFNDLPPVEFGGKKEVSSIEVARILKITRTKLNKVLIDKNIFTYLNGRYLPHDKYVKEGWFRIDKIQSQFVGIVPKLVITIKGFNEIKNIVSLNGK